MEGSEVRDRSPSTQASQSSQRQRTVDRSSRRTERSGSRHRRHRSRSRHRRRRHKLRERNFIAAVCSTIVIVTISTALAEPSWFYIRGGGCNVNYIGVYQFFSFGYFEDRNGVDVGIPGRPPSRYVYHYSSDPDAELVDCVTPRVVRIIQAIIALCFLALISSIAAFILDLFGPSSRVLKIIRRNGIGNIITVIFCVVINGFCYWITQLVEQLQFDTKIHKGSKIEIRFDISFYLIAGAGGMSVVATACNLLRRYPMYDPEPDRERLIDDYDGMDPIRHGPSGVYSETAPQMEQMTPPPAYTP